MARKIGGALAGLSFSLLTSVKFHPIIYLSLKRFLETFLIAALYIIAARIGFLVAVLPGNVTPLWPASGIALAAIMLLGDRAVIGIWLGSFLVNLWFLSGVTASQSAFVASPAATAVAVAIATGSTLQAGIAARLIRHLVGTPLPSTAGEILGFISLSALSTLVAPSVGVTGLYLGGFAPWDKTSYLWWTWWVGDYAGILIVAPALGVIGQLMPKRPVAEPLMPPLITSGVGFSLMIFFAVSHLELEHIAMSVRTDAIKMVNAVQQAVDDNVNELEAIRALHRASGGVEWGHFRVFVKPLLEGHTTTEALSLVVRVTQEERVAYEQARRREGLHNFVIFERDATGDRLPAKRRADYFPMHYIEPLAGNEAALGFDIGSTPAHLQDIIRAIDSGQPVVTGRVALVPKTSQSESILVLVPIYREGGVAESLEARRAGFVAFASGMLRMDDALKHGLKALGRQEDIELFLFDVTGRDDAALLAFHPSLSGPQTLSMNAALSTPAGLQTGIYYIETFSVYGRQWQVLVRPGPAYVVARREWNSWIYLLVGLTLTGTLLYYLSSRQRADSRLKQADNELRRLNIKLAQRVVDHTAAEERARQSEERFRSMIENVKDHSIIMLDASGCVITWNKGAERLRGYHSDEIIGKHYSCLFPNEDRGNGKAEQILKTALSDGQCEEEGWRLRKDGSRFWADVVVNAVRDAEGNLIGFSSVTRDLTKRKLVADELKLAKEAADAANQAKSDFLANISHEIRTPMAGIVGMVGLLFDTNLSPRQREYCEMINRSGESLLNVINEVLDFSKIESGKLELETIDFNLRSVVEEVVDLFAKQAEDKGIEFINFFHCDVPADLRGDPGRARQILSNLVSNALKFTEKGEVAVRVTLLEQTSTHANVRFSVSDTGIGIPPEKVAKLFTAFTQADASTTRKFGGTGLGLAICKRFVELMGGEIGVYSHQEKGSTFWFTLGLLKQHEGFEETLKPRTHLQGLRMLVVEGNPTNRAILEHYLTSLGISCQCAEDGPMAVNLLSLAAKKSEPFDLAILDSTLPGISGSKLARVIRENRKFGSLKVVFLIPVGKREAANLAKQTGIDAYLTKPVHFSSLVECLALLTGDASEAGSSGSLVLPHMLAQPKARQPLRILVADDNHISQKVTVSLLEKMGHRANVAGNGKEAVEAFKLVPYDAVLMDLQMPEMDGFEASTQIRRIEREQNRQTSIIAVTAHARNEDREKCLASGMDDFITKPIKPEDLKTVIARRVTKGKASPLSDPPSIVSSGADVFNLSEALAQVGGDRKLLREITRLFMEQLPELLEEAHQALSRSDYRSLSKLAHTLASSVGQLAAQKTLTAAKKLEELGNREDSSHVPEALAELEREIALLKSTISGAADFPHRPRASRARMH